MSSNAGNLREQADACPGVLTLHEAADGALARVRLPGGVLSGRQLSTLVELSGDLGNGSLELTSRGNLQLRGLPIGAAIEVGNRLADAGLLPSATHERVRNIVASPLSGIDGRGSDVTPLVAELDRALCASATLAELPGRFLFALDDGRGDIAPLDADVLLVAHGEQVIVGPFVVGLDDAVPTMLILAGAFLSARQDLRSQAWRIADLAGGMNTVADRARGKVRARESVGARESFGTRSRSSQDGPVGVLAQPDGRDALVLLAPLGRLDRAQGELLAAHAGTRGLRVTPWRSVVIPDLDDAPSVAAAGGQVGLGCDSTSPWYRVSACTGRPGCARALADVQLDARAALDRWPGQSVRWSGCERQCGRPSSTDIDVVAASDGYRISERPRD